MKGIIIKFDGFLENSIKQLFRAIDLTNYSIDIRHWETNGEPTFLDDNYNSSNVDIISIIMNEKLVHYAEFVELLLRNKNEKPSEVHTYHDFVQSSYVLSLVINDHHNIEICSKNEDLLNKIIKSFNLCNLDNKTIMVLNKISDKAVIKAWRSKTDPSIQDEVDL